eukprot:4012951-Pleurochrysis_carterae.AAC.1
MSMCLRKRGVAWSRVRNRSDARSALKRTRAHTRSSPERSAALAQRVEERRKFGSRSGGSLDQAAPVRLGAAEKQVELLRR